ncbi:hypothetical protein JX265_006479 [Neoarthrinium moseri]|uniref:Uncharacterized protein n=1 Tax=Neoarthrinium moseri TaxID=1658444 RepID=A0A9Q0AQJ7_9PEZI|nr:hypothetical protein JX265_006479 [Neoarthrinium moseri]
MVQSGSLDPSNARCEVAGATSYSPGMCPGHMTSVTVSVNGDEYVDICCESGFSWDRTGCLSIFTEARSILLAPEITTADTWSQIVGGLASHTPMLAAWHTTDLGLFPSDVQAQRRAFIAGSTATSTPTATFTGARQTSNSITDPAPPSTSGDVRGAASEQSLSPAAKIGIGVGAAISGIAVLAYVSACLWKRRQRWRLPHQRAEELDSNNTTTWKLWLGHAWRAESGGDPRAELSSEPQMELDGQPRAELQGSPVYYRGQIPEKEKV